MDRSLTQIWRYLGHSIHLDVNYWSPCRSLNAREGWEWLLEQGEPFISVYIVWQLCASALVTCRGQHLASIRHPGVPGLTASDSSGAVGALFSRVPTTPDLQIKIQVFCSPPPKWLCGCSCLIRFQIHCCHAALVGINLLLSEPSMSRTSLPASESVQEGERLVINIIC